MAMSEVPPLTVWSPLAWIASFERLKKLLLAIWRVAFAARDVMVGVVDEEDEGGWQMKGGESEVGPSLYLGNQ